MFSPKTLPEQIAQLESAVKGFRGNAIINVDITLKINDDVPEGFVKVEETKSGDLALYRKVIEAKDGVPTKSIVVAIPD